MVQLGAVPEHEVSQGLLAYFGGLRQRFLAVRLLMEIAPGAQHRETCFKVLLTWWTELKPQIAPKFKFQCWVLGSIKKKNKLLLF